MTGWAQAPGGPVSLAQGTSQNQKIQQEQRGKEKAGQRDDSYVLPYQ
jgi:hypothetical protein